MKGNYISVPTAKKLKTGIADFSGGVDYFTDESVMSPARAKDCYNFDFSRGALRTGYGLETYSGFGEKELKSVWLFTRFDPELNERDDRLIAADSDGKLWYKSTAGNDVKRLGGHIFASVPSFINYRLYGDDVVLICSPEDGMFVWDGKSEPYKVENAPRITSMALHYERLFVTIDGEKNAVWFSDDLDPTNWDASLSGGGFIQMIDERGALNRVVSYLNYVYVFRDYGISRITAFGSQSEFSVSNLFVSSGRIYAGSVALCGDVVVFLAEDGLYAFDGVSTRKLLANLDGMISGGEGAAAYYAGGKYYLAFRRGEETEDDCGNNALLALDISRGNYSLGFGMNITGFGKAEDGSALAITKDGKAGKLIKCGAYFGKPLPKKWRVPKTDMGDDKRKFVREVGLCTAYPCTLTLRSDERELKLKFKGAAGIQRKRVAFSGRRIGYDIETDAVDADISRPRLTVVKGSG